MHRDGRYGSCRSLSPPFASRLSIEDVGHAVSLRVGLTPEGRPHIKRRSRENIGDYCSPRSTGLMNLRSYLVKHFVCS